MKLVKMLQKAKLKEILNEEREHTEVVDQMLSYLGSKPSPYRDIVNTVIGRAFGLFRSKNRFLYVNYLDILDAAIMEGHPELGMSLLSLAAKEEKRILASI